MGGAVERPEGDEIAADGVPAAGGETGGVDPGGARRGGELGCVCDQPVVDDGVHQRVAEKVDQRADEHADRQECQAGHRVTGGARGAPEEADDDREQAVHGVSFQMAAKHGFSRV